MKKQDTKRTIRLTEKEAETLKSILEALLKELEDRELNSTTRELLDSYSRELDLSGDSTKLAEDVAKDILSSLELSSFYENGLILVKVVYEDGVESCEKLLREYSLEGLWDSIRERKETLESTLQKVYARMEYLDKVSQEELEGTHLELQETEKPSLEPSATQDRIRVYAKLVEVLEEATSHLEEINWYKEKLYPMGASDFILDASIQLSELLNSTEVTEQDFIEAGYPELWKSFQENLIG